MKNTFITLTALLVALTSANGQVDLAHPYIQNFDSLLNTGSSNPWVNNSTLAGWYSTSTQYTATGSGSLASLGVSTASDRALGGSIVTFGVRFINNSTNTLSSAEISYRGEQWIRNANSPQLNDYIYLDYKISQSGSDFIGGNWIEQPSLMFSSPNTASPGTALLDGNSPDNSSAVTGFINNIAVNPGEELWIRWQIIGTDIPNDHTMGIDDLSIQFYAIPEPASYSTIAGLAASFLIAGRRRRSPLSRYH